MEPMNQPRRAANIEARLRVMQIIWLAMLASVGFYALIAVFIRPQNAVAEVDGAQTMLFPILLVMGLSTIALSFVIKHKLLAQAVEKQQPELTQTALIVALAMCDAAALFGFVSLLVTGNAYSYALFALGAAGMLMHMPRREHLLAATYKTKQS